MPEAPDIRTVDPASLADIQDVRLDPDLPREARLASFLEQIRDPTLFRCGKLTVQVSFAEDGPSLEDLLESLLSLLA